MDTKAHHAGVEPCLAGERKVPRGFSACCSRFDHATQACTFDTRFEWWPRSKSWVVRVADGGSSGIEISFCPFCGAKLGRTSAAKGKTKRADVRRHKRKVTT
jgi:hypothetical protein